MSPAGPLMREHRLIERMVSLMSKELQKILQISEVDLNFIDTAIDFIKTYADRCHHGKEEDILFRELDKKQLSAEHRRTMEELIKEHVFGRETTGKLLQAKQRYTQKDKIGLHEIALNMDILIQFYPKHIEKEDKHFFLPCMDYFTEKEKVAMLKEFWEFDKRLIHEKYKKIVDEFKKA